MALNRKMVLPLFSTMKVCEQRAALGWGSGERPLWREDFGGQLLALSPRTLAKGWGGRKRGKERGGGEGESRLVAPHGVAYGYTGIRSSLGECHVGWDLVQFQNDRPNKKGPLIILAELFSQQRPGPG